APSSQLPVSFQFEAVQAGFTGTFKPDQNLRAAALIHEAEQIVIRVHGEIGFGEPADLAFLQLGEELLPVASVHKGIVVREFDERPAPQGLDAIDFLEDSGDRLLLVARGEQDRARAAFATEGAAATRLNDQAIILRWIEQIVPGQRRISKGKIAAS